MDQNYQGSGRKAKTQHLIIEIFCILQRRIGVAHEVSKSNIVVHH